MEKPDKNIIQNDIKRSLNSVDKFLSWAHKQGYIENGLYKQSNDEIANKLSI